MQNGNVYTSEDITFGSGLFPAVISVSGDTAYMTEVHQRWCLQPLSRKQHGADQTSLNVNWISGQGSP
jgi:hypothetical protein